MTEPRKYSVAEIDAMRKSITWSYGSGSYDPAQRAADTEDRLRTYMQNGTEPEELAEMAKQRLDADLAHQRAAIAFQKEMRAKAPPPRVLKTKEDVIDEWYQTSVAHYEGATDTAKDLYDGFMGKTLKRFANNHAPDGINVTQRDMEKYLDAKGVRSRNAMFAKRYDGICHIIHGNVRSGNYGT